MFSVAFVSALPHGLCVGIRLPTSPGDLDTVAQALVHSAEYALARRLAHPRRMMFVGGRVALREALGQLGIETGPILKTPRGAPTLPVGVSASVSHKDGLAVALVDASGAWRVGVDLELVRRGRTDITRHVLTDAERCRLPQLSADERTRAILIRFCLKEAAFKALDPFVERFVSFHELSVEPAEDGNARLNLRLSHGEGPFDAEGYWQLTDGAVIATARVRRRAGTPLTSSLDPGLRAP